MTSRCKHTRLSVNNEICFAHMQTIFLTGKAANVLEEILFILLINKNSFQKLFHFITSTNPQPENFHCIAESPGLAYNEQILIVVQPIPNSFFLL